MTQYGSICKKSRVNWSSSFKMCRLRFLSISVHENYSQLFLLSFSIYMCIKSISTITTISCFTRLSLVWFHFKIYYNLKRFKPFRFVNSTEIFHPKTVLTIFFVKIQPDHVWSVSQTHTLLHSHAQTKFVFPPMKRDVTCFVLIQIGTNKI